MYFAVQIKRGSTKPVLGKGRIGPTKRKKIQVLWKSAVLGERMTKVWHYGVADLFQNETHILESAIPVDEH